jgi:hypothetical protein
MASGSKKDVAAFIAAAFTEKCGKKYFDFNKIIPMPNLIHESFERGSDRRVFYDEQAMALLLMALNDAHGIVKAGECALVPNSGSDDGRAPHLSDAESLSYLGNYADHNLSPLESLRDEVTLFIAGVDRKTGISSHPLSPHATRAMLQKIMPGFFSTEARLPDYVARLSQMGLDGKVLWSQQEAFREGPASLERLAKKMIQSPYAQEALDSGIFQLRVIVETGYKSWYEWCVVNWNTKWNAGDTRIVSLKDSHIDFLVETAWSFPVAIFDKLREMFPRMKILCVCRGESCGLSGWGYFTGLTTMLMKRILLFATKGVRKAILPHRSGAGRSLVNR